ncbi:unnamed protein product [Porites evermanni]|uniref:Peptidase C1A papain C-terminal domain-containing protein n=1 Tax=Porites evermanni TaxID=104178 RepID=A0ABN8LFT2_9CNID|nr:unnamed protein product [Porites evermanni]
MLICICRWKATVYKQFAGMDWSDAKKMLGSYGPWPKDSPPKLVKQDVANEIPDSFDARTKWPGSIHEIRNQGDCGSCWAFGASEVLSDRFAIVSSNRINVVLSAQQLVDCNTVNHGCNGGWPLKAWQYMSEVGLLTVQCYGEYTAKTGTCRFNGSSITQCPSGYGTPRFYKAENAYTVKQSVEAIQTEIMTNGPVEAAFTVYQDFFSYRSGVYIHTSGQQVGGHAIKMLGWGRSSEGVDYWICANSWGPKWGMDGFFYIRRGTNECGIESGVTAGIPAL